MTRDEMYDLILGAVAVAIAYHMWKQHKGQGGTCTDCGGNAPAINVPAPIPVQGDASGYWYDMPNLMAGAV